MDWEVICGNKEFWFYGMIFLDFRRCRRFDFLKYGVVDMGRVSVRLVLFE